MDVANAVARAKQFVSRNKKATIAGLVAAAVVTVLIIKRKK